MTQRMPASRLGCYLGFNHVAPGDTFVKQPPQRISHKAILSGVQNFVVIVGKPESVSVVSYYTIVIAYRRLLRLRFGQASHSCKASSGETSFSCRAV